MSTDFQQGDLVFLTEAYERYMYERNPKVQISFVNRLARIEDVIDWDSPRGQKIKDLRMKSGKWEGLPLEDNKYLLSIFYHDLKGRGGQQGVIEQSVPSFSRHPKTGDPLFVKIPDWIYKYLMSKCQTFDVETREDVPG